jgi:hypothetical protein
MARPSLNYEPPVGDATGGPSLALGIYHYRTIIAVLLCFFTIRAQQGLQVLGILFRLTLGRWPDVQSFAVDKL